MEELEEIAEIDEPEEAAPALRILDAAELVETFLGRTDTVKGLLVKYLERTSAQRPAMRKALEAGDWELLRREAHTIKGSALNLSAKELGAAAAVLELAAKDALEAESADALEAIAPAFVRFRAAAEYFIKADA